MDEQALELFLELDGLDNFSPALADGGPGVDEERDIAAELRGKSSQPGIIALDAGELIQDEQDRGGITAASTETGADGDFLFQMNADAGAELEFGEEKSCGLGGEVVLRVGERGIGAGELNAGGNEVDVERVAEGDRRHEGFELVETVGTASKNVEIEIDLGGSELFH